MNAGADRDPTDWSFLHGRVAGRLMVEHDRALYVDLYSDPTVMAHIGPPMTVDAAAAAFVRAIGHNRSRAALGRYWRLAHARSGEAIGLVALVRNLAEPASAEVGVVLLPAWQNRGVGVHGLAAVVDGVMSRSWPSGIEVLLGRHAAVNLNAGRLTQALGFRRVADDTDGRTVWRLDRDGWAAARGDGSPRFVRSTTGSQS